MSKQQHLVDEQLDKKKLINLNISYEIQKLRKNIEEDREKCVY